MKCLFVREMQAQYVGEDTPGGMNHRVGTLEAFAAQLREALLNVANWEATLADMEASPQNYTGIGAVILTPVKPAAAATATRGRAVAVHSMAGGLDALVQANIERYHRDIQAERRRAADLEAKLVRQGATLKPDKTINWGVTTVLAVKYQATDAEKQAYAIDIDASGRLRRSTGMTGRDEFDTSRSVTAFQGAGVAIFVMTTDGQFYSRGHSVGAFHHSSFLAGAPVACAGEWMVNRGQLTYISNKSGHYRPGAGHLLQALEQLRRRKVKDMYRVEYGNGNEVPPGVYPNRQAFIDATLATADASLDLEKIRLLAYWRHLKDATLLASAGMRWAKPGEQAGVYVLDGSRQVWPREVRRWLKGLGRFPEAYVS